MNQRYVEKNYQIQTFVYVDSTLKKYMLSYHPVCVYTTQRKEGNRAYLQLEKSF